MNGNGNVNAPLRPLREESGRAARCLTAANDSARPAPGEQARAWAALQRRRQQRRAGWLPALVGAGALAALATGVWIVRQPADSGRAAIVVSAPARSSVPAREPVPAAMAPSPGRLPAGDTTLAGGVRVRLSAAGVANVMRPDPSRARITLDSGTLDVAFDGAAGLDKVEVRAAGHQFEGQAGRFTVGARPGAVTVAVHDGRVAVWTSRRMLAQVFAGQRWSSSDRTPARAPIVARASPEDAVAPATEARDCLRLAGNGATEAAIACLEAQAAHPGLTGELALMELARIHRDVKADLPAAERALAEYGRRFPRGSLVDEAGSTRVEILLQLGRASEALARAETLPGDDGIFWRAVCLAKLGRDEQARAAFDDYLTRPGGTRRTEALRRRGELDSRARR
jgi:ferric-dicitrate binding protein FerR (iron transport regulator)